ncbi:hypothetical protein VTK26DRAFT_3836 [Humicola hyalothermophila]
MSNPQDPTARPPGREHIPIYPRWFIAIRIAQLVLAICVLGMAAYAVHYIGMDANQLILAVAVLTLVASVYHMVTHYTTPFIYNYWAVLALDVLFVVLWLVSFALLAARVAELYDTPDFSDPVGSINWDFTSYRRDVTSYRRQSWIEDWFDVDTGGWGLDVDTDDLFDDYDLGGEYDAWRAVQAAAAALGGVEFALFAIALAIHSLRVHRHRAAGLPLLPGAQATTSSAAIAAGSGPEKFAGPPVYTAHPQPQEHEGYPMQPYPPAAAAQPPVQGYYQPGQGPSPA